MDYNSQSSDSQNNASPALVDFTEIADGERWEMFARDFLSRLGYSIVASPSRGADGGKDLVIQEVLPGKVSGVQFSWLVSCKHFASRGAAVSHVTHESNILDRVRGFRADGFLGFYSTLPSSSLADRLEQLRAAKEISDYFMFDATTIEGYLISAGYSDLLMRYFPVSYKRVKPAHLLTADYLPLKCDYCSKDLLASSLLEPYSGLIAQCWDLESDARDIIDVYTACKSSCDVYLERRAIARDLATSWTDISDLLIPVEYLRGLFSIINCIADGSERWHPDALSKMKHVFLACGQRTLRYTSREELRRVADLISYPL